MGGLTKLKEGGRLTIGNKTAMPVSPRLTHSTSPSRRRATSARLKIKLQSKLNQPRIVDGRVNQPKRSHRTSAVRIRQSKLGVVEEVEKLCSKVQPHALAVRQDEVFDRREISVYEIRAVDRGPTCSSQFPRERPQQSIAC